MYLSNINGICENYDIYLHNLLKSPTNSNILFNEFASQQPKIGFNYCFDFILYICRLTELKVENARERT